MKNKPRVHVLLTALLFLCLLPLTAAAQQEVSARLAPIDLDLLDRLAEGGTASLFVQMSAQADLSAAQEMSWEARGDYVWDALNRLAEATQAPVLAYAHRQGLEAHSLAIANAVYIRGATLQAVRELAALPGVAELRLERTLTLEEAARPTALPLLTPVPEAEMAWGVADVHAPELWSAGVRGAGVIVANIDTGVQWDHPALIGQYGCPDDPGNPACWYDPSNVCGGLPCDNLGHGTFTMGLIAAADDPALPYTVGLAPDVTWIACKGCESSSCSEFALHACAQWTLAPGGDPANRPHVVDLPWSAMGCDDWFMPDVMAWQATGIVPVSKIGSNGFRLRHHRKPRRLPGGHRRGGLRHRPHHRLLQQPRALLLRRRRQAEPRRARRQPLLHLPGQHLELQLQRHRHGRLLRRRRSGVGRVCLPRVCRRL